MTKMSLKSRDKHNRWRNKTISFRMSDEENKLLDRYVKMSGLSKQDYIIGRVLATEITVKGTPKVYTALKDTANEILAELKNIDNQIGTDPELLETIKFLGNVLNEFKNINN